MCYAEVLYKLFSHKNATPPQFNIAKDLKCIYFLWMSIFKVSDWLFQTSSPDKCCTSHKEVNVFNIIANMQIKLTTLAQTDKALERLERLI